MQVLDLLCGAAEYDELPVRHNEDRVNAELAPLVRWSLNPKTMDDPHTKANLLLQVRLVVSSVHLFLLGLYLAGDDV
jgi:activating signal cointegrator complex subunit 3